jgi:hypothetical protein
MHTSTAWAWCTYERPVQLLVHAPDREHSGPPDAGNLHVRWDEGGGNVGEQGIRLLRHDRETVTQDYVAA